MPVNSEYHANGVPIAAGAVRADGSAAPFARVGWFDLLGAHCFDPRRIDIAHAIANGVEVWLPLVRDDADEQHAMANWYSFSYGPLFSPPGSARDGMTALAAIAARLRQDIARITLSPVSDRDGSLDMLHQAFRAAGWVVAATKSGHNHWLEVGPGGFDAYWQTRPGALRSTVKRKAAKGLVTLTLIDRFDSDLWSAYEAIYANSWKPREGFPAFLRAFAEAEGSAGRLRFGLARIGDKPVAAQFWTIENGTAYIHKLAHVEDSEKASPGTLLSHALFRHAIDVDGVNRIDFGTGDDAYKRDWMNRYDPLWTLEMLNPSRPGAWPAIVRHAVRRRLTPPFSNKDVT